MAKSISRHFCSHEASFKKNYFGCKLCNYICVLGLSGKQCFYFNLAQRHDLGSSVNYGV